MKVYTSDKIRNVIVLGHGGSGKTALVEAMAYVAGATSRLGRVEDGNTISDYDKEEQKRQFSINSSIVPVEWEDTKINLLDVPGYFDFVGEVEQGMSVADGAVIVVSAKSGIEVGTKKAWEFCEEYNIPRIFYVTDMDDDNASFRRTVEALTDLYGRKIAPFQIPVREEGEFVGFVNVVKMGGRRFVGDKGEYEYTDIPDYVDDHLMQSREVLLEAVAETSEELMEKYFDDDQEFTQEEISSALINNVHDGSMVPVLMGSGINPRGSNMLLQVIKKYFPSPAELTIAGKNTDTDEVFNADYDITLPVSAKVFKSISDPFIGKFSVVKVCSGILKSDSTVYNTSIHEDEKISRLYVLRGKDQIEVDELHAGDIGAIGRLDDTRTGDTLSDKNNPVEYERPKMSEPYTYKRFRTVKKGDDDKVSQAMAKLLEEDLTLKVVNDSENRQTLLYGIGDQQLDVAVSKLKTMFNVEIELLEPKIPYRETIRKTVKVQGKHKKQSGGHGQYGDVHIEFSPSGDLETPYVFEEHIFGGAVPRNYFPAVEKGIAECVEEGPLAGYPVVGVKADLVDGSYHPVDSSELAFKMATIQAFRKGFLDASPAILEPIVTLKVVVPDEYTGDVMGDLNKRRGRVLGMNPIKGSKQEIVADVPLGEIYGYCADLRSFTAGAGDFSYEFNRYEQATSDVQERVIAESKED